MTIRKATFSDASRLAEILIFAKRTAYRCIFQNDKVSFGEMQVLPLALQYIENPQLLENIYVFDDEFVKGMLHLERKKYIEIKELYIDPFFQGQGIGEQLLKFTDEQRQSFGSSNTFLWVLEKNKKARKFYEKHGFHYIGEKKIQEGTAEYLLKYQYLL